ncbi:hypothetical protein STEG23_001007, partial [Scotinomys teguina]
MKFVITFPKSVHMVSLTSPPSTRKPDEDGERQLEKLLTLSSLREFFFPSLMTCITFCKSFLVMDSASSALAVSVSEGVSLIPANSLGLGDLASSDCGLPRPSLNGSQLTGYAENDMASLWILTPEIIDFHNFLKFLISYFEDYFLSNKYQMSLLQSV